MRDENQLHAAVVELLRWIMRKLNIQRCKTGIQAMKKARAVFIIL